MRLNPFFQPFTQRGPGLESLLGFTDGSLFGPSSTRVRRTEAGLEVQAILPGVDPADLEIELEGPWLTLSGKSRLWEDDDEPDAEAPGFRRRFKLPFAVDSGASTARLENGVLTLTLPRPEADAPRRIALQESGAKGLPQTASEESSE